MGVAGGLVAREPVEWRSRPWRGAGPAIGLVGVLFTGLAWYAGRVAHDGVWAAITVVAGLYVLSPLTVPVRYRLDGDGLVRRSWIGERRFPWKRFSAWRRTPNGRVAVLRFAGRGPARWSGGLSLFLPEDDRRDRALETLVEALGPESQGR